MNSTEKRAAKVVRLARQIHAIATTPAEVTTGEDTRAQANLAALGVELAEVILDEAVERPRRPMTDDV